MSFKGQYKRVCITVDSEQKLSNFKRVLNFLGFLDKTEEDTWHSLSNYPKDIQIDCVRCTYNVCYADWLYGVKVDINYVINTFSEFPAIFCIYADDVDSAKESLTKLNYLDWQYSKRYDGLVVYRFKGTVCDNTSYDSLTELESKTIEQVEYNFDINSIVNNPLPEKVFIATNGDEKLSARVQRLMQARGYDWQYPAYKSSVRFTDADYLLFDSVEKAMFQSSDDYKSMQEDGWMHVEVEDLEQVPIVLPPATHTLGDLMKKGWALPPTPEGENPKLAIGNVALPMTLLSPLTVATGCLGKLNGKLKYGGSNYIGTEVIMSTYMDAIARHFAKIQLGEDVDSVDGVPHWGAIIANIDIILSAKAAGTLIDDRLRSDGQLEAIKELVPLVKSLQELHKDKNPKHYYAIELDMKDSYD